MGNFITIRSANIKPSQDFLKEKTVRYIMRSIEKGDSNSLPPTPIVRKSHIDGEYIAIDGHNLIAVNDYLGKLCDVYVADSPDDKLTLEGGDIDALAARNKDLHDKYDSAYREAVQLNEQGLGSFNQLWHKYPELFDTTE